MKTICIYHSIDLDGWMSAAVVKHWFLTNNKTNDYYIYDFHDYEKPSDIVEELCFLGWNYGDEIPTLSEYDRVIMCDVSFSKEEMLKLWSTKGLNFIWIDHHISAIKEMENSHENISLGAYPMQGLRDTNLAACELTWIYFMEGIQYNPSENYSDYDMPEIVRLLGMYDSFRHKGTDEEEDVLEFQYGARVVIKNYEDAYTYLTIEYRENGIYNQEINKSIADKGLAIYQYLCTEAKQIYKNGFEVELKEVNPKDDGVSILRKFICFNKERFNPINFGIDYHKDGYDGTACFHYANGYWNFSLYNANGEVDCSQIAKQYGGGGHKGAAGFRIENIEDFVSY